MTSYTCLKVPHYLISDDYDQLITDTSIKRVYERGDFSLQDLHSVVPHYLTQEHKPDENDLKLDSLVELLRDGVCLLNRWHHIDQVLL